MTSENFIKENQIIIKNNTIFYKQLNGPNISKPFSLTYNDIILQLNDIKYNDIYKDFRHIKNNKIENYKMIPFAYVYYYLIAEYMRIPKPDELLDLYLNLFCVSVNENFTFKTKYLISDYNIIFDKDSLYARILRAYNSFNRELALFVVLNDYLEVYNIFVCYDSIQDLCQGIDILINKEDKTIGLATYVNTKRSNSFKYRKNTYRHDYSDKSMIDFKAILSGPDKNVINCGDIFIYSDKSIDELIDNIVDKVK